MVAYTSTFRIACPGRRASVPVIAALAFLASGCGYLALGTAVVISSVSSSSDSSSTSRALPVVNAVSTAPARASLVDGNGNPCATEIAIDYRLVDAGSAKLNLDVVWWPADTAGAVPRTASEIPGGEGRTGLSSSPAGEAHRFVWDAKKDLQSQSLFEEDVVLLLTPWRGTTNGVSEEIRLRAGNNAPTLTIQSPANPSQPLSRNVLTMFTVSDWHEDVITATLEVAGGGTTFTAQDLLVA
ncbi:hypothetical protein ACFL59_11370, partial [Planctomycetota bacterium]